MVSAVLVALIFFIISQTFKPSVGVFHCLCSVPNYGEKEVLVTVQVVGENWGASVLKPTNISLNIFGNSISCDCESV
ncbi:MAG: hypothetical protein ACP5O8_00875 [Candidatus Aenigmatarchaeota archaeon]